MFSKAMKKLFCVLLILSVAVNGVLLGKEKSDDEYKVSVSTQDLSINNDGNTNVDAESSDIDKRFINFRNLLLKSVPENRKADLTKRLEKLSKNKEFLEELTPEKINQIKKEIKLYKQDNENDVEADTEINIPLDLNGSESVKPVIDLDEKNITFDFPNVTLVEFTRFVANLNEKILIGDNLLQGNVTLKTPEKISLKELMEVFEALLNSNGLSYMISTDYLQIFQKSDSTVRVYKINYLKSKDVAKTLKDIFKMSFRVGGVPEKVMIDSLDQANSVIVLAPKEKHTEIAQAIKEIDFRRRQVLMEVRVIELTYTENFGFGNTFAFGYEATSGGMAPSASQYVGTPMPPNFTEISKPYSGVAYNNGQFMYNLEADKRISKIKILSQPRILTSENQKAQIKVGQQQPVVNAETNMGVDANKVPIQQTTVDWKEIGVDLNITPRVNSKRDVTLDLEMTITSILRTITVGNWDDYPVIGQRIVKNSSTVKDNQLLVIGGLLKDEKITSKVQVPFFGDMPFIGQMFATYEEKAEQTELLFLIIPRVIESPKDGMIVTKREINTIENYDVEKKAEIQTMIDGKRDKSWKVFNLYDYFNDDEYREEQMLIPQEWGQSK